MRQYLKFQHKVKRYIENKTALILRRYKAAVITSPIRLFPLFFLVVFTLSTVIAPGAEAAMRCGRAMQTPVDTVSQESDMPACHKQVTEEGKGKAKAADASTSHGCKNCACQHGQWAANAELQPVHSFYLTNMTYFTLPISLASLAADSFYPPPKTHS